MDASVPPLSAQSLFEAHPRLFETNRYVYPVLSRRAGGISIGINLNVDKRCNFDCIYCQVDRGKPEARQRVELDRLAAELDDVTERVTSGRIYQQSGFQATPPQLRRLSDLAFSGDGEPTACPQFDLAVEIAAKVRHRRRLDDVKLVLITNATLLDRAPVRRALKTIDANGGEIWAKLDAGTAAYHSQVARSPIAFERILRNLATAACERPLVIQSLFMRIHGQPPSAEEQDAYCQRLADIRAAGGQLKLIQIHTVARSPAESWVTPLSNEEVDALASLVRQRVGLPVATYYGRAKTEEP